MASLRDLFNGDVGDLQRLGIKFGHGLNHPDIFAYLKSSILIEALGHTLPTVGGNGLLLFLV